MNYSKDYYFILGIHPSADDEAIKAVYRALSKKYHPDTSKIDAEEAAKKIRDINEAYAILSEKSLREDYDRVRNKKAASNSDYSEERADDHDSDEAYPAEDLEPDNIHEPDEKRGGEGLIISGVIIILLAGIFAGASIMREKVISYWSGANTVFSFVGLRIPQPGDGLDLRFTDPQRDKKVEDKIVINLIVENMTEKAQPVPDVITQATDANGTVVQKVITQPPKRTVKPGETIRFKAVFEKIAPTARDISIPSWGELPSPDNKKKKQN